ncbi:vanadium-dependent haloperoxidase [Kribbella sp. CA-245084]|uniref:vanadium-dependent haloperoxidase n=1 Tax=Kribbella sp. CA-245084 TaxID=3239940 RepID=UPI003D94ED3B
MRITLPAFSAVVAAGLAASVIAVPPATATQPADPAVVITWNAIAARTILTENATPVPVSTLYFGFVSIAVYDAVVTIEGRYQPYLRQPRARGRASTEAAAATAAYRVLNYYFPTSAQNLAADYAASLGSIPDSRAKDRGQAVGEAAASSLIAARANDGRGANITLDVTPAPGVWRPTPDAFAPMLAPWLGFVRPLALRSPKQVRLSGPDPITSKAYARDFAEVKAMGAKDGTSRTAAQTETALFWNGPASGQYNAALRERVSRSGMDIVRTARAFALLGTSEADALIACWRAKYDYAFWRPITAIRLADTDGNRATAPDPAWTPLVATPPYPEYTSGHACLTGASTEIFSRLFGARSIDLNVSSPVTSTTRHYATATALDTETKNARIWLGLHFRHAMNDGNQLGHRVATWTASHEFLPRS